LENQQTIQPPFHSNSDQIDFSKLWSIIKNNFLWILLIFIVVNAAAYLFIRYTKNLYESESELKLDIKSEASELGISRMIEDQNLNIVSGEIEIIQSKLFLNKVLENSSFEISFYSVGRVLNDELFVQAPAIITSYNTDHSLYDRPITFEEINSREFKLVATPDLEARGQYGKTMVLHDLQLVLDRNPNYKKGDEVGYFFLLNSRGRLLDYLSQNLTAEPLNFNANTIRISFKDHNPFKAQTVLNKIDTLYLQYSNEQKNQANKQKIDWLISELAVLEKKMESHENYFENFTLQNKTNDLDEDLRQTIIELNSLDSQRYNYTQRLQEINKLITALSENKTISTLSSRQFIPAATHSRLEQLQKIQLEQSQLTLSHQQTTFAYRQKQQELESLRFITIDELTNIKKELSSRLQDLNGKKSVLEKQFAGLPDKNTEFSKNQRFYKLYEELYLTLMQSKSEFEIAQAGSIPDFKILSPASFPSAPISPKKFMIMGVGVVASIVINFFFIFILYLVNNKITNLNEIEKISGAPLLGAVPVSKNGNGGLHIIDYPKSMVSESIRTLRTNLDFFSTPSPKKVIAISSTVSGEGKSFIAMNLGGVIALSKKRVILIDLDMRKNKINLPVNGTDDSKGVSTILIRRNSWQECVIPTSMENFDYIASGPHPPNPSELLLNGEFTQMINDLKAHYDFVILDTPPVGLVTDGIMAMKKADVSVYIFRANYSKKDFLSNLRRIITINKIQNITTVLNALPSNSKTYGYGYYEEGGKSRNLTSFFKR
jgi:tyrosine-protein kinase Etk/Wzc